MYHCTRCDIDVAGDDRARHSATAEHQTNGGSAEVVDDDYTEIPPTRGMSKT